MTIFTIKRSSVEKIKAGISKISTIKLLIPVAEALSLMAIIYAFAHDTVLAYGDAESHINIAKRVVDGITPGMAQLGGVWLPLPHMMMLPLVKFDFLWRTGLAGSLVSGVCFIIASIFVYKLTLLITTNRIASVIAFLVFVLNPNILYLQSTPLTEMPLITFIVLSSYYFIHFLKTEVALSLVLAAFFGFCATLSRYDGWFVVLIEAGIIFLRYLPQIKTKWQKTEGLFLLFATPAFLGILLWLAWDWLILGDPFYFTTSQYSARAQQLNWLARGQLPTYHNLPLSFLYYFVDALSNVGVIMFGVAIVGMVVYLLVTKGRIKLLVALLLLSPFLFNVISLFMGQSIIFIPHLTPVSFDWRLFNARYGVIMVPAAAFFVGFLFYKVKYAGKLLILFLMVLQIMFFVVGYSDVIAVADGVRGLSSAKRPDAERWLKANYDGGFVLLDDFSRATSIVRSGIPMQKLIYIGNKPYWLESLIEPEKYASWVVIQKDDTLWHDILEKPEINGRLYKYFSKVYTSPDILIFKRNGEQVQASL